MRAIKTAKSPTETDLGHRRTGKTGAQTAALLLARGHDVCAFVHREDDRAADLRARGADVFVGDLLDVGTVASSLAGAETAYFCYPVAPGLVDATAFQLNPYQVASSRVEPKQ